MKRPLITMAALVLAGAGNAEPVQITRDMPQATVQTPDGPAVIARIQDNDNLISGDWALTSRSCPPFCVQPMTPVPEGTAIGEPA